METYCIALGWNLSSLKYQYLFDFDASLADIGNWMGSSIIESHPSAIK